jgi:hypothetical protein
LIHPDTEVRRVDDHIGHGVFATKRIPRGSITWALDHLDHVLTREQAAALPAVYHPIVDRYAFQDAAGRHVLCWDHGRFVNHSCDATSLPLGSICEIAVRDILPGEQVTSDYVTLNLDGPLTCRCGSSLCRGVMRPEDLPSYAAEIDAKIRDTAPLIGRVPQPVLAFMLAGDQARFEAVRSGRAPIPTCREVIGES